MKGDIRDLHVLITRPNSQADQLLELIRNSGVPCVHFPLLNIERMINTAIKNKLNTLNDHEAVICISRHAAQFGLDELRQLSIVPTPHLQWFAMGQSTADVFRRDGLSVTTPDYPLTSESLLALPWFASISNKRIMIWKGVGGRELLEKTLKNKGANVNSVELYQRDMPIYAPNALDQVLIEHDINIIMISSGQALENLWQLTIDKAQVTNTPVIVPSIRVADQARVLGFNNVLCANGADDQSMLTCLQQYQMQTEENA